MQTLQQFLAGREVTMQIHEFELVGAGSPLVTEPWATRQYHCRLFGLDGGSTLTTVRGSNDGPPDVVEVLDAIAAEAAVIEETDGFDAWARRMGYDPDSRRSMRVFRSARRRASRLREMLGDTTYERLLWDTERL